jgi:hypothetical protein
MLVVSDGLPGGELQPAGAAGAALQMGIPIYPLLVGHQARIAEFNMRAEARLRPGENSEGAAVHARYAQTILTAKKLRPGYSRGWARLPEAGRSTRRNSTLPPPARLSGSWREKCRPHI